VSKLENLQPDPRLSGVMHGQNVPVWPSGRTGTTRSSRVLAPSDSRHRQLCERRRSSRDTLYASEEFRSSIHVAVYRLPFRARSLEGPCIFLGWRPDASPRKFVVSPFQRDRRIQRRHRRQAPNRRHPHGYVLTRWPKSLRSRSLSAASRPRSNLSGPPANSCREISWRPNSSSDRLASRSR